MNENNQKVIVPVLKVTFISYMVSFVVIMLIKGIFAFINGEEMVETLMMAFRSYLLGSLTSEKTILSMRVESIGLFAVHFTLFFSLLLYYTISEVRLSEKKRIIISIIEIVIGIVLIIFMRERFIWCLPFAVLVSGLFLLIGELVGARATRPYELGSRIARPYESGASVDVGASYTSPFNQIPAKAVGALIIGMSVVSLTMNLYQYFVDF